MTLLEKLKARAHVFLRAGELLDAYDNLMETFVEEQYKWLFERIRPNTSLIDIGAGIGDTAFYFKNNKNITGKHAFEPNAWKAREAERWLKRSNKAGISFHNVAINTWSDVKPYLSKNYAIKCDVEGAEHFIFPKEADLSGCYVLMMEYHNGLQELPRIFAGMGFSGNTSKRVITRDLGEVGFIYAERE